MIRGATVARPYAKALFCWTLENQQTDTCPDRLQKLSIIVQDLQIKRLLKRPGLNKTQLVNLLSNLADIPEKAVEKCLLGLLAQQNRLSILTAISQLYEQYCNAHKKVLPVDISTISPLTKAQEKTLIKKLQNYYPEQTLQLSYHTDLDLLGGFVVRIRDFVIDCSVKQQLQALRCGLKILTIQ